MDRPPRRGHDRSRFRRVAAGRARRQNPRPALPNLLVPIDLRDATPTPASLFALAESRRVARIAGATVYAIVLSDRELPEQTIARLGRAGADKVLLCEGAGLDGPPLEATHASALLAAVERVSPLLVLFPAGGAGVSLGPSLAARLGAAFAGPADLEVADAADALPDGIGRVFVRFWGAGRTAYRRLDPVEIERPVVAILPADGAARPIGSPDIDHDVITCATPGAAGIEVLSSGPDDRVAITLARVLVLVDPSLGPAALALLREKSPAGVAVADAAADAAAVAAATPEVLILVGVDAPPIATPRSRTGPRRDRRRAAAGWSRHRRRLALARRFGARGAGPAAGGGAAGAGQPGGAMNVLVCLRTTVRSAGADLLDAADLRTLAHAARLRSAGHKLIALYAASSAEAPSVAARLEPHVDRAVRIVSDELTAADFHTIGQMLAMAIRRVGAEVVVAPRARRRRGRQRRPGRHRAPPGRALRLVRRGDFAARTEPASRWWRARADWRGACGWPRPSCWRPLPAGAALPLPAPLAGAPAPTVETLVLSDPEATVVRRRTELLGRPEPASRGTQTVSSASELVAALARR